MSVLDQSYRRWSGTPTGYARRVLVIPHYDILEIAEKRTWLLAWLACLVPPLILGGMAYLATNMGALRALIPIIPAELKLPAPGATIYQGFLSVQCWMLAAFAVLVGPPLATRDFANGAIPLYLSKSLSRWDYVLGRCAVLAGMLSLASWLPYLVVFVAECGMADAAWRDENWKLAGAIVVGTLPTVLVLTLVIAAVGALVQRTNLARAALLFLLLALKPLAGRLEAAIDSPRVRVVSPTDVTARLRDWAFETKEPETAAAPARFGRAGAAVPEPRDTELGAGLAAIGLLAWLAGAIVVLARRVRPVEVVR